MELRPLISDFKIKELSWIFWMDSVYLQESLKAEKKVFRNHQKHKSTKHVMLGSHFKELESQYYNYQELPIT